MTGVHRSDWGSIPWEGIGFFLNIQTLLKFVLLKSHNLRVKDQMNDEISLYKVLRKKNKKETLKL